MIQFAAAVASLCSGCWGRARELETHRSLLVACGVVGGVTAAYNAPLASVCFAAEIVLGGLRWKELPALGVAATTGWSVSGAILGRERLYPTPAVIHSTSQLLALLGLAVLCGFAGPAYQWLLGSLRQARRLPLAMVWSAVVVGCLSVKDVRVWGNGDAALRMALATGGIPSGLATLPLLRVLCLRFVATLACVWTGTVGGVFTPTLFAGGAAGTLVALSLTGHGSALCAVAGMSLLMAAVTHAPLMAACMAVELTGNWRLLPVLLPLNLCSWAIARRLSRRAMYAIASEMPAHNGGMPPVARRAIQ